MKNLLAVALLLAAASSAPGQLVPCNSVQDPRIWRALQTIEASVDPCGEDQEIRRVLDTIRRCAVNSYRVCTSEAADRNTFDPPTGEGAEVSLGTITWNPTLTTELESDCDGDSSQPVLRDPTASLLHELVHAAQDCQNLEASELELDAVRIENIYRRAAGLCQRSRYGDQPLPRATMRSCKPGHCSCRTPQDTIQMARDAESDDEQYSERGGTSEHARLGDVEARDAR